jgi:hypothetical protein
VKKINQKKKDRQFPKIFLASLVFVLAASLLFVLSANRVYAADFSICVNPLNWFKCLLLSLLSFITLLIDAAATLFAWTIDVGEFKKVVEANRVVYEIWKNVKDILNISFILVLLYSAFCTILQIEKYNYKKLLLNLVIMALLVNFSFPIARFIVDVSNTLMYTIANMGWDAGSSMGSITKASGIKDIFNPANPSVAYLLTAIIFGFILAVTLVAVGLLMVVRMIALTLLIIFSPIAFIGAILPDAGGYSGRWWKEMFNYSFFGPVMLFVIYIATKMMGAVGTNADSFKKVAAANSPDPTIIGSMALFALPIIILWMGMRVAKSMSIAGADAVIGGAQKFAKWLPKSIANSTGIPGGIKKAAEYYKQKGAPGFLGKIPGLRGEDKTKQTEAWFASKLGVKGAEEQEMKRRAEEYKKNNETKESLRNMAAKGDAAAAYRLAIDGDIDDASYAGVMNNNKNESVKDTISSKVREKRADIIIDYRIDKESAQRATQQNITLAQASQQIAEDELNKINPSKWKDQNIGELFGYDVVKYKSTGGLSNDPKDKAKRDAAKNVYHSYRKSPKNQDKFIDDMNGEKYVAGQKAGVWP